MAPRWRERLFISLAIIGGAVLLIGVFAAGYAVNRWTATPPSAPSPPSEHADHADHQPNSARDVQLWTCSMHPQIRQPKPGKCPICGMDLVPVKQTAGGLRQLTITPDARKLMEIEVTPVVRKYVTAEVRMVGKVAYDETRLAYITAWVAGRLDRMFVDYTGVQVRKGDHMVSIYSPELYAAQNDLIQDLRFATPGSKPVGGVDLVESAREKLRLLGLKEEQIKEITRDSKPSDHITIYSPTSGTVIHKNLQQGDYVKVGERIYTVTDLTHLWILLDAYESDLEWLRYGQEVVFTSEAYPGERFIGRIAFIDPVLNDRTRTVKVRVNVPNPTGKLKPEMFVNGIVQSQVASGGRVVDAGLAGKWISPMHPEIVRDKPGKCPICGMPLVRTEELGYTAPGGAVPEPVVIPVSAALVTGTRAIVYLELPGQKQPTYEGREIVLGPRAGDYYLVSHGLKEGELVVTHGNFKIDSALQIQAKPSMMTPEGGGGGGHHHGGSPAPGSSPGTAAPMAEIPAAFRQQLAVLHGRQVAVTEALAAGDLDRVRKGFGDFGAALKQVNAGLVTGHARMMWDELAMLLGNDAAEGSGVKELADARRVAGSLAEHLRRLESQFDPPHAGHGGPLVQQPAPSGFQKQVGGLLTAYSEVQAALASDDEKKARDAAASLQQVLARIDPEELPPPLLDSWKKEKPQLEMILKSLSRASDLKGLREEFAPLSGSMAAIVTRFGIGGTGPVYRLQCSMAFENRGATWLQTNEKPLNPYFGSKMLGCANRTEKLLLPRPTLEKPKKEGHSHE